MHAATVEAAQWWERPRGATNAHWVDTYKKSLTSRHRDVIVAIVQHLGAVASVLEVGCHCGPNLMRLAQATTIEQLTGIDVNADAVTAGNAWAAEKGLTDRVQLVQGRIPDKTSSLADGCVDVVLSCYALAYIAPADLDAVLYEMGRLAKRAVILAEPMSDRAVQPSRASLNGYNEWAHNYVGASKWIGTWRGATLSQTLVTPPVDRLSEVLAVVKGESSTTP